jgi:hypothetical protein
MNMLIKQQEYADVAHIIEIASFISIKDIAT